MKKLLVTTLLLLTSLTFSSCTNRFSEEAQETVRLSKPQESFSPSVKANEVEENTIVVLDGKEYLVVKDTESSSTHKFERTPLISALQISQASTATLKTLQLFEKVDFSFKENTETFTINDTDFTLPCKAEKMFPVNLQMDSLEEKTISSGMYGTVNPYSSYELYYDDYQYSHSMDDCLYPPILVVMRNTNNVAIDDWSQGYVYGLYFDTCRDSSVTDFGVEQIRSFDIFGLKYESTKQEVFDLLGQPSKQIENTFVWYNVKNNFTLEMEFTPSGVISKMFVAETTLYLTYDLLTENVADNIINTIKDLSEEEQNLYLQQNYPYILQ